MYQKIKIISVLSLSLSGAIGLTANAKNAAITSKIKNKIKPNVIFIYADDMGKGMLSAYGQKYIKTPNIDKLIKLGVSFSNAYGCHYSAPARASMLTGYSDAHAGHWNVTKAGKFMTMDTTAIAGIEKQVDAKEVILPKGDDYLPQIFNRAGYFTGEIGKLDYGFQGTRKQTKAHGWNYYYGYLDHVRCHGYYPPFLFENGKIVMIKGNTYANAGCVKWITDPSKQKEYYSERWNLKGKAQYAQDLFDTKIKEFIDKHHDKPFFLYHPSMLPHGPLAIPRVNSQVKNNPELNDLEKEYASMVLRLDQTVGMIYNLLKKWKIIDNTIIIFSSDNGHTIFYALDGHTSRDYNLKTGKRYNNDTNVYRTSSSGDIFNGNMGMAGLKWSNYEGGIHVPLTFYWKGHLKPSIKSQVVSNYDLLPTMADMLNISVTAQKDGVSYLPILFSENQTIPDNRYVLVDSREGPAIIMNNGWKLRYDGKANVPKFELFNLRKDLGEYHDLASQYPNKVEYMKQILLHEVTFTELKKGFK